MRDEALDLLYPLTEFYEQAGLSLPEVERMEASQIPEPYRSLLVHENDMTPTLERFHQQPVRLRMLNHQRRGDVYSREVLLLVSGSNTPVEFGAIRIYLHHFSPPAQQLILENRRPLGSILSSERITHTSHPRAYIRIASDMTIGQALQMESSQRLYGRRNVLLNSSEEVLAEIVEILPPLA
jgi:chorismate-pyruvate lyase